jgi:hypothetical protein
VGFGLCGKVMVLVLKVFFEIHTGMEYPDYFYVILMNAVEYDVFTFSVAEKIGVNRRISLS